MSSPAKSATTKADQPRPIPALAPTLLLVPSFEIPASTLASNAVPAVPATAHGQRKTQGPRIRFRRINDRRQLGTGRLRPRTQAVLQRRDNTAPAPANKGKAPAPPAPPLPPPPTEGPTEGASTSLHPLFKRVGFAPDAKVPSHGADGWLQHDLTDAADSLNTHGNGKHVRDVNSDNSARNVRQNTGALVTIPASFQHIPQAPHRPTQAHITPLPPITATAPVSLLEQTTPVSLFPPASAPAPSAPPVSMSPPTTIPTPLPAPPAAVPSAPPPRSLPRLTRAPLPRRRRLCPRSRIPACTPNLQLQPLASCPGRPRHAPLRRPWLPALHSQPLPLTRTPLRARNDGEGPRHLSRFVRGAPSPSSFASPPSPTSFLAPAAAAARPSRPPPRPSLPVSAPRAPSPAAGSPDTRAVRAQCSAPSPSPFASSPLPPRPSPRPQLQPLAPPAPGRPPPRPLFASVGSLRAVPSRRLPQHPSRPCGACPRPPPRPSPCPQPQPLVPHPRPTRPAPLRRPRLPARSPQPLPPAHAPSALEHDDGDGELLSAPSSLPPNSLFSDRGPPAPGAHKHRAALEGREEHEAGSAGSVWETLRKVVHAAAGGGAPASNLPGAGTCSIQNVVA
ncbi:hypothetical protein B0H14DRAFT_3520603 [Mycena olivaceomarginata]|nr:hypothetical protein B0H14DRAFT_3520603 [Mycena olivaceomarginata]